MGRPYVCPYCGANKSVSKGVRKTKTMGDRRIRLCKACGRKFTPKNQKPMDAIEKKPAETSIESSEAPKPAAASKPEKVDEPAEESEAKPESDASPDMVSPPDKEWTS